MHGAARDLLMGMQPVPADVPRALVCAAYDVGSAGYNQAASVGHVMAEREGVTLRVIPGGNDVAHQAPLIAVRAHFGALGIASFLSQEAVMELADSPRRYQAAHMPLPDADPQAWERALAEQAERSVRVAEFPELWMGIRTEELKAAGFDPYWEEKFW